MTPPCLITPPRYCVSVPPSTALPCHSVIVSSRHHHTASSFHHFTTTLRQGTTIHRAAQPRHDSINLVIKSPCLHPTAPSSYRAASPQRHLDTALPLHYAYMRQKRSRFSLDQISARNTGFDVAVGTDVSSILIRAMSAPAIHTKYDLTFLQPHFPPFLSCTVAHLPINSLRV